MESSRNSRQLQEQTSLEDDEDRREFMLLVLLRFRRDAEVVAQELVENSISLAEFERRMARLLRDALITATAAAHGGGWEAITEDDLAELEAALEEQLEHLHGFAEAIYNKVQAEEELTTAVHSRAKLYAGAAWTLYWLITQGIKVRDGATEVRLITMGDEKVCDLCLDVEAMGYQPIGSVTVGQIHVGCRCGWEFR